MSSRRSFSSLNNQQISSFVVTQRVQGDQFPTSAEVFADGVSQGVFTDNRIAGVWT